MGFSRVPTPSMEGSTPAMKGPRVFRVVDFGRTFSVGLECEYVALRSPIWNNKVLTLASHPPRSMFFLQVLVLNL